MMFRSEWITAVLVVGVFGFCGCAQFQTAQTTRTDGQLQLASAHHEGAVVRANNHTGQAYSGYDDGGMVRGQCCDGEGCDHCSNQIEFGQPHRLVDGIGWFFGIPSKLLLWDSRAENHNVSPQTVSVVRNYLRSNGMSDVKVRMNQYAPGDEWRRLTQNKSVSPGWRYTVGALRTAGYTIFPERLFGGDNYNPFTNTISIYSDIPAMAVHEAAYARDNAAHEYRGTYGFFQQLAGINIWHETKATRIAHGWMQRTHSPSLIAESNRVLPPLYGMRVGGSVGQLFPPGDLILPVAGAITGHAVGSGMNRSQHSSTTANDVRPSEILPTGYTERSEQP